LQKVPPAAGLPLAVRLWVSAVQFRYCTEEMVSITMPVKQQAGNQYCFLPLLNTTTTVSGFTFQLSLADLMTELDFIFFLFVLELIDICLWWYGFHTSLESVK
jgi:hypothetical protein